MGQQKLELWNPELVNSWTKDLASGYAEDRGGSTITGELTKTASGLIDYNLSDDASFPWVVNDWTAEASGINDISLDGSGNLTWTHPAESGGEWRGIYESAETTDEDWYIQALTTLIVSDGSGRWVALGVGDGGGWHAIAQEVGTDSDLFLLDSVGTDNVITQANDQTPAKAEGTFYRQAFWSRPNSGTPSNRDITGYDFTWDVELVGTNLTASTEEYPVFGLPEDLQVTTGAAQKRYKSRTPIVTVTNLPTGYVAHVEDSSGNSLGSDEETSGTASINLMQVNWDTTVAVRVYDGSGVLRAELEPSDATFSLSGVFGGETYQWSTL